MESHNLGSLFAVSTLTLGGGGLGMLWGPTTFEECIATVQAAVAGGINLLDLAPRYGNGKAERVVGEAFGGRLPNGVHITSKCNLGTPEAAKVGSVLRQSIEGSLRLLQRDRLISSSCTRTSCRTGTQCGTTRMPTGLPRCRCSAPTCGRRSKS